MYEPLRSGWPSHSFLARMATRMKWSQYNALPRSCTATPLATTASTRARCQRVRAASSAQASGTSSTGTIHTAKRGPQAYSPLHER